MVQRHSTAWSSIAWPTAAHLSRAGHTPSIPARPTGNVPVSGGVVSWTVGWSQTQRALTFNAGTGATWSTAPSGWTRTSNTQLTRTVGANVAWSTIAWPTAAHISRAGHTPSIPARPTGNVPATGGSVSWTVGWSQNNIPVTGVRVSPSSVNLDVGRTHTLSAMVLPTNATNQTVIFTSSNNLVATVSSSGVVTANSAGTAIITVWAGNGQFSDTSTVRVTVPTVSGVLTTGRNNVVYIIRGDTGPSAVTMTYRLREYYTILGNNVHFTRRTRYVTVVTSRSPTLGDPREHYSTIVTQTTHTGRASGFRHTPIPTLFPGPSNRLLIGIYDENNETVTYQRNNSVISEFGFQVRPQNRAGIIGMFAGSTASLDLYIP